MFKNSVAASGFCMAWNRNSSLKPMDFGGISTETVGEVAIWHQKLLEYTPDNAQKAHDEAPIFKNHSSQYSEPTPLSIFQQHTYLHLSFFIPARQPVNRNFDFARFPAENNMASNSTSDNAGQDPYCYPKSSPIRMIFLYMFGWFIMVRRVTHAWFKRCQARLEMTWLKLSLEPEKWNSNE